MLKSSFRLLGRLIIVLVLLASAYTKINEMETTKYKYLQSYDYCRVALR
jgi:hypothetical protein